MHWREAVSTLLEPLIRKPRVGLITDMDGTISPIELLPDQAHVTPRNRELLEALREKLTLVAVVSGRKVEDLQARVGLPGVTYIGNHGLEYWVEGNASPLPEAAGFRAALEAARDSITLAPGMFIEDKGVTLSIHYRLVPDAEKIIAEYVPTLKALANQYHLRFYNGRMVFELRPPLEIHKGTALMYLVGLHRLDAAIFIGDDTTDVDALKTARQLRESESCYALGLGVTSADMPVDISEHADAMVQGVGDVETFLDWLLQARIASST